MPPKKQKTNRGASSSSSTFDANRFKSFAHEQRFNNLVLKKRIIRERGIQLKDGEYPEITTLITSRKWMTLCRAPEDGCQTLVREFYANAYHENEQDEKYMSFVRGKAIYFTPRVLNRMFGTPQHFSEPVVIVICWIDHGTQVQSFAP